MPNVYLPSSRGVAQPGSASALGAEGRVFESRRPDQHRESALLRAPFRPPRIHTRVERIGLKSNCDSKPLSAMQIFQLRPEGEVEAA